MVKLLITLVSLILDFTFYPFKSLKNFLKTIFFLPIIWYFSFSLLVVFDYVNKQYGNLSKFFCQIDTHNRLQSSVVRIVGGYSEGSGFFIADDQVLTNFHVIADEPSPKIIFPDGSFITPIKITGSRNADLAILYTKERYPNIVLPLPQKEVVLYNNEPLISAGYPLGTKLSGKATILKGNFGTFRTSRNSQTNYIQTDINLIRGMSGGPLVDQCGQVVGINNLSLAGNLSLFISADVARSLVSQFTDKEIAKIEVDPSKSPEEAVRAFYTYLKARRMEDGFNLLSQEYRQKTSFEEWTNRFIAVLDVDIIKLEQKPNSKNTVFLKFTTKNWVDGAVEWRYYEGTWETISENGIYKMYKSQIKEIKDPEWSWFYK